MNTFFNFFYITFCILLLSNKTFSQEKNIKHKVMLGENVFSISEKYKVTEAAIYELNPDARISIKLNSILLIPIIDKNKAVNKDVKTHIAQPKETLFGIAKKHNVSVPDLIRWNSILDKEDLKINQKIIVSENSNVVLEKNTNKIVFHEVVANETKYSISKRYNVSLENLEKQNPEIKTNLPIGFVLKIELPLDYIDVKNNKTVNTSQKKDSLNNNESASFLLANKVINRASEKKNVKYQSGGNGNDGFDCSGLMVYAFENSGISLPRTSFEQSTIGKVVNAVDAKIGDLIFFGTNGVAKINHVGLIIEVNQKEIKFIHASVKSGVIISSTSEVYYKKDFVQINRVIE